MINLLPPLLKKELKEEEYLKTVRIIGLVSIVALLAYLFVLMATSEALNGQLEIKKIETEKRKAELAIFNVEEQEKTISDYNVLFSNLKSFYSDQKKVSNVLEELLFMAPQGILLSNFTYNSGDIFISGYCPDRDTLVSFKDELESSLIFKNISFPPSNWIKQKNISFNVSFDYESER